MKQYFYNINRYMDNSKTETNYMDLFEKEKDFCYQIMSNQQTDEKMIELQKYLNKNCNQIVLVLDTETTGLPPRQGKYKYPKFTDYQKYDSARIVQFSAILYNFYDDHEIEIVDFILKPDNFVINNSKFHGITQEKAIDEGVEMNVLVKKLKKLLNYHPKYIIGHNIQFDMNIIKAELCRFQAKNTLVNFPLLNWFNSIKTFCTMEKTKDILKLPYANSKSNSKNYKPPRLSELFKYIYGYDPDGLHNSLNDTIYTLKCCIELYNHDLIILNLK